MSIGNDIERTIKITIQSYIDKNYPGIEFRLSRFDSKKECRDLTGSEYWERGYLTEFYGKGKKQQGILSNNLVTILTNLGEKTLIAGIEEHTKRCIKFLLDKIEVEIAIKLLSNKIEKDKI